MTFHTHTSDSLYHRFFAHPEMVIDLLRGFLDPVILAELDLNHLRRHNTKFTAKRGQRRRSDVVWEIPTRHGSSIFILLILEFQSEIDAWMALRVVVYYRAALSATRERAQTQSLRWIAAPTRNALLPD
ncbi:MAG: Rpn family recombination-promoting nuclease/putative transposase [Magnetococcales bacterium]|nr:Rpn family recombination-promoting nuclease/putative transposase [Magnetococcales bacterium]NGZ06903.1 Rpn family recombination-promoting nuclease/putative transposase [Magnetococcales bacterium]